MNPTRFVFGLFAGLLLGSWNPAVGADLFQIPAGSHLQGAVVRGASLGLLAGCVASGRRWMGRSPGSDLLAGAALGFLIRGAVLYGPLAGSFGLTLVALSGVLALVLSRRDRESAPIEEASYGALARVPALLLGAAGVGVALEGLARHTLRLGAGEPGDVWVMGAVGLLLLWAGGLAFGRFLRTGKRDRAGSEAVVVGVALAGLGTIVGLWTIARIGSVRGLDRFVRRFGMDTSDHGSLIFDVLVNVQVFVVPCFLLGVVMYAAGRRREELASILAGLAVAPLLVGWRMKVPEGLDWAPQDLLASSQIVVEGVALAGAGALLAVLSLGGHWAPRLLMGLPCFAALGALALPVDPLPIATPWTRTPVVPLSTFEIPEGLMAVYPDHVALNQTRLTPRAEDRSGDDAQIRATLEQVAAPGSLRVLWIGQLDPGRATTLFTSGRVVKSVDRTASWSAVMDQLEASLFGFAPRAPGEILTRDEAASRLSRGQYDLVIVPGVGGGWTRLPAFSLPEGTRCVVWQESSGSLASQSFEPVILAAGRLDELWVGTVRGMDSESMAALETFPVGLAPMGGAVWTRLAHRSRDRRASDRVDFTRRMARGTAQTLPTDLARGLVDHFVAQTPSSPFDSYPGTLEISDRALGKWSRDLSLREPGTFTRGWWNQLAEALVGKRRIQAILDIFGPVVERDGWERWPELDRALAYAEREALEPDRAAERLLRLTTVDPDNIELAHELADALAQAGRHGESAKVWKKILFREPGHHQGERELAVQLLRAGDPKGTALAEEWLADNPEDEDLRALLSSGPIPVQEPAFDPGKGEHDHGDGQ